MAHSDMLSNKHDTFFFWTIAVSDSYLLETYKNLGFLLSTVTFTVNSHADNHFYKYICFKY